MSDIVEKLLQDNAYEIAEANQTGWSQGVKFERERIIKLLEPLAKHDEELCVQGCWPEDCSAPSYLYAIELIKKEGQSE